MVLQRKYRAYAHHKQPVEDTGHEGACDLFSMGCSQDVIKKRCLAATKEASEHCDWHQIVVSLPLVHW